MGFTMLGYISCRCLLIEARLTNLLRYFAMVMVLGCGGFTPLTTWAAGEFATTIKQAQVELLDNNYVLNAEINYNLSPIAKAALLKGIALTWTIPVVLQQKRDYFWPKELSRVDLRYQVQYFALLNVYRVKAEHTGQVSNFGSLTAALNAISVVHALFIVDKKQISPDDAYQVKLKVNFEREALPTPLRPIAYFKQQWDLSSDWKVCQF